MNTSDSDATRTGPSPGRRRRLRVDADANRTALLDASERVLHRDGPGGPLELIAREAGVGIATLYRNLGSREDLYRATTTAHSSGLPSSPPRPSTANCRR